MDINYIYTKIKNRESYINGWEDMKRASVIVPIVKVKDRLCILFELRSRTLRKQPGDVCFPGGGIEVNETPEEAALRETEEELGLKSIDIIKELDVLVRYNGLILHSFLGEVKDLSELNISKDEVESVFYVPIDELLKIKPIVAKSRLIAEKPEDFPYNFSSWRKGL